MNSTLFNGYSGIKTHQFGLDSTSNNIANINTTGYRANMPEFRSLFSNALTSTNPNSPVSSDMNYGSSAASNAISTISGSYQESDGELNIAYAGKGWFVVGNNEGGNFNIEEPNSNAFFTRDGSFARDAQGYIVNSSGHYMMGVDLGKIQDGVFISNKEIDGELLPSGELQPLKIPQDLHYGPTQTTQVSLAVNLNPNQSVLPAYEVFSDSSGQIDNEAVLNQDINSFLVDEEQINAEVFNDVTIKINQNNESKEYVFKYKDDGENGFRTLGELMKQIKDKTGLDLELSKNTNGDIHKNITLELKNNSLSNMNVELGGRLFDKLGLKGSKDLDNLKIKDLDSTRDYEIGDYAKVDGAIFQRINSSGYSNPLDDEQSWVLVDSNGIKDYNVESIYDINSLVKSDGKVYQKIGESNSSLDDTTSWRELGSVKNINIDQYNENDNYAKNDLVYFNNSIYIKIGDSSDGNPENDKMNWKILDNEKFLSSKMGVANYKTTTEIFDENGKKQLIVSKFVLQDNSSDEKIWSVKTAVYDKDGSNIISDEVTSSVKFDKDGKIIQGDDIELKINDRIITYSLNGSEDRGSTSISYIDSSILGEIKDGVQKGELSEISIDNNGLINLAFSNGITETMGRVGIVAFVNDQGLQKIGGNLFEMSAISRDGDEGVIASGNPILGWDTDGNLRFGQVLHKYLETSNVNPADAMTDLIVFQRGYAMNAKAFTTGDDLIKEAINLKR